MATDPELLKQLSRQAFQRGEFKDEQGYEQWLRTRGLDKYGNQLPDSGSPFMRGLVAGVPGAVYGTAERVARAFPGSFGEDLAQQYREQASRRGTIESERTALGTAPQAENLFGRKQSPEGSRQFASGATLTGMAGEIAKYNAAAKIGELAGATRAARPLMTALEGLGAASRFGRFIPGWGTAAAMGLGAVEDVGSLPEESTAGALSGLATAYEMPRTAKFMRGVSESGLGRAVTGATLGILPEAMIRGGINAGMKRIAGRGRGAPQQSEVLRQMFGPIPNVDEAGNVLPSYGVFPEGFSAGLGRGAEPAVARPSRLDAEKLLDDVLSAMPPKDGATSGARPTAGSRRVSTGMAQFERDMRREVARQQAEAMRGLNSELASVFKGELGAGARRTMVPIDAEREARQIILRRNRERQAAVTGRQQAFIENLHAAEDARLAGTPVGEALKRITPASAANPIVIQPAPAPVVIQPAPAPAPAPVVAPASAPASAPVATPASNRRRPAAAPTAAPVATQAPARPTQAVAPTPATRASTPAYAGPEPSAKLMDRARAIIALRKKQDASAKTRRQKDILARERATQDARMAGTAIGEALRRIGGTASAASAMSLMAAPQEEDSSGGLWASYPVLFGQVRGR